MHVRDRVWQIVLLKWGNFLVEEHLLESTRGGLGRRLLISKPELIIANITLRDWHLHSNRC